VSAYNSKATIIKERREKIRNAQKEKVRLKEQLVFTLKDFDKSAEVAMHYGFLPIKTPQISKDDIRKAKSIYEECQDAKKSIDHLSPLLKEKVCLLRTYKEWNMTAMPHPVMIYFKKPYGGSATKKKSGYSSCDLEIIGAPNSVAEALIIKTTIAILNEEGFDDLSVDINNMGDKESITKCEHELSTYFRKNINELPSELRQMFKNDVFDILRCPPEKCGAFHENAPKLMNFLSESSIQNFKEVLEYLETLNIPYKINNGLVGNKQYCSHTMFEIRKVGESKKDSNLLAVGTRHNHIGKKLGFKKDISVMSVSIHYKKNIKEKKKFTLKKVPKTKFYFVQMGFQAKLKSLGIIESLRKAKISVYHSLSKDKFGPQLASAENLKSSHLLIMGVKEAMEDTIVVRNATTRSQETVKIEDLPKYLKKVR